MVGEPLREAGEAGGLRCRRTGAPEGLWSQRLNHRSRGETSGPAG